MPTPCLLDHPGRHKVNLRDCLTLPTTARPVYYAPIQYHKVSKAIELARTCPSNCSLIMKIRFSHRRTGLLITTVYKPNKVEHIIYQTSSPAYLHINAHHINILNLLLQLYRPLNKYLMIQTLERRYINS